MLGDKVGKVEVERVFDEGPAWFATRGIPSNIDVIFKIRNDALVTSMSLDVDGFEKEFKGLFEARLCAGTSTFDAASKEISRKLARVKFFLRLGVTILGSRLITIREPESIHDDIGENVSLAGHHAITDVIQMEKVIHKVGDDAKAIRSRGVIAICGELSSLKAGKTLALLVVKKWAIGVEPLHGLRRDLITIGMIDQREGAVGHKVRKDEEGWLIRR
jgi:hypothetical protein